MHQGGGGPPPLLPEIVVSGPLATPPPADAAAPISIRMPGFEALAPTVGVFREVEALAEVAGEEGKLVHGGAPGNRWPRQETLALLKIRSDMNAVFRDATHKGPLWEEVSRKLGELGYVRSAKKCREKFENVHKYYKRTKEGRAGRQDGKSYRFFSQLEALQVGGGAAAADTLALPPIPTTTLTPPSLAAPQVGRVTPIIMPFSSAAQAAGVSFSSNTSSSASDSDDEDTEEAVGDAGGGGDVGSRKRKAEESADHGGGSSRKMMAFFEGLMKQVMERQEAMQSKFLEALEKRDQDRMIREEAWRRQEATRVAREHELITQERAMAASRDAAIISFLQKLTGQTIQIPPPPPPPPAGSTPASRHAAVSTAPPAAPQPISSHPPPPLHQHQLHSHRQHPSPPPSTSLDLVPVSDPMEGGAGFHTASPSRWPKAEVQALIQLRTALELKYQEVGPKGPLWEEISSEMRRLGYNRSAKRCKEKWENINKYFKKVKESNKKRPEDAKTCPYYHQLDALYRKKLLGGAGGQKELSLPAPPPPEILAIMPSRPPSHPSGNADGGVSVQSGVNPMKPSNGGLPASFFADASGGSGAISGTSNKPEAGIMIKELMEQHGRHELEDYGDLEDDEPDSDNMVGDDDEDVAGDDVEDDVVRKTMEYAI